MALPEGDGFPHNGPRPISVGEGVECIREAGTIEQSPGRLRVDHALPERRQRGTETGDVAFGPYIKDSEVATRSLARHLTVVECRRPDPPRYAVAEEIGAAAVDVGRCRVHTEPGPVHS